MTGSDSTGAIRAAVIGTGFIGTVHVEAARRAGASVVGLLGSSPQRTEPKAAALGVPKVYRDIEELAQATDVDVVHVTSPNYLHAEQAKLLLQAGKHVICEKPLALNADDGRDLVATARNHNRVNATCFNIRFYPLMHQAHSMIKDGSIGSVLFATGSYHQDWLLLDTDWNWRLEADQAGRMRAVADIGSHWMDLVGWITGSKITKVMADLYTAVPTRRRPQGPVETFANLAQDQDLITVNIDNDDAATLMFVFDNGARGALTVSQISAGKKNNVQFEIAGAQSSLSWLSTHPDELFVGHRGRPSEIIVRDPGAMASEAARVSFYPAGHVEGFGETFRGLFERVYSDVAAGEPSTNPSYPTFADGLEGLEVADAIWRSNQTQQWEQVERKSP